MKAVNLQKIESGTGPKIVILHGLLGAARNWGAVARDLSTDHHVICLDLPNHGGSDWIDRMDYPFQAEILGHWIAEHGGPMVVLGHSMGGKIAMTLAVTKPDLVRAALIADIAPVAYDHDFTGFTRAMRAAPVATLTKRAEVEEHLAQDLADARIRAFLMQNLESTLQGFRWRANLDAIDANHDFILGFPDFPDQVRYDGPALFISGGLSHYVTADRHPAIQRLFPQAEFQVLEGCGHWLHADNPQGFIAGVRGFLARHKEVGADL